MLYESDYFAFFAMRFGFAFRTMRALYARYDRIAKQRSPQLAIGNHSWANKIARISPSDL